MSDPGRTPHLFLEYVEHYHAEDEYVKRYSSKYETQFLYNLFLKRHFEDNSEISDELLQVYRKKSLVIAALPNVYIEIFKDIIQRVEFPRDLSAHDVDKMLKPFFEIFWTTKDSSPLSTIVDSLISPIIEDSSFQLKINLNQARGILNLSRLLNSIQFLIRIDFMEHIKELRHGLLLELFEKFADVMFSTIDQAGSINEEDLLQLFQALSYGELSIEAFEKRIAFLSPTILDLLPSAYFYEHETHMPSGDGNETETATFQTSTEGDLPRPERVILGAATNNAGRIFEIYEGLSH